MQQQFRVPQLPVRAVHRFLLDGAEIIVFVHASESTGPGTISADCGTTGPHLTPAMHELTRLVEAGLSQREMAGRLGVALGTVRKRLDMLYKMYQVHSRAELVADLKRFRNTP
jgi:DNA-binding CsgD family transcriptional regulator